MTLKDKFYEHLIVGNFNSLLLILRCLLTVSEPDHATVGNRRVAGAMCHKPRICSRGTSFHVAHMSGHMSDSIDGLQVLVRHIVHGEGR